MSVVVYKDGRLGGDTRAYGGRQQPCPGLKTKVHCLDDGSRVGIVSAVLGEPERFIAWMRAGAEPSAWTGEKPDLRAIIVRPNGEVFLADDSISFAGPIECDAYAIGSGGDFAMGAIRHGATLEEALQIACDLDPFCAAPFRILEA